MKTSSALLALMISLSPALLRAELMEFTIDSVQSSLTVGGSFLGIPIQEQGPNSLTTHFTGTIQADVTSGSIQFVGGSVIVAQNSGDWEPGPGGAPGSAPANYGAQGSFFVVSGKAAVRNIVLDLTSGLLAVSEETFPAQDLVFRFPEDASSTFDYSYTGLASGSDSEPLAGNSTNNVSTTGTYSVQGGTHTVAIPVDFDGYASAEGENDVRLTLQGQLIASTTAAPPLEIGVIQVADGQLNFSIATKAGQAYTIQGSTNLTDWPLVVDQFTATNSTTVRSVPLPAMPSGYFRIRED